MLAKISEDLGDVKKKEEYMSNPWGKRKKSRGDCSRTFRVNPDSICDSANFKRFRLEVNSVFSRDKKLMMHLLFGIRIKFKCHE